MKGVRISSTILQNSNRRIDFLLVFLKNNKIYCTSARKKRQLKTKKATYENHGNVRESRFSRIIKLTGKIVIFLELNEGIVLCLPLVVPDTCWIHSLLV